MCQCWRYTRGPAASSDLHPQRPFVPAGRAVAADRAVRGGDRQRGWLGVALVGTGSISQWPDGCFFWVQQLHNYGMCPETVQGRPLIIHIEFAQILASGGEIKEDSCCDYFVVGLEARGTGGVLEQGVLEVCLSKGKTPLTAR